MGFPRRDLPLILSLLVLVPVLSAEPLSVETFSVTRDPVVDYRFRDYEVLVYPHDEKPSGPGAHGFLEVRKNGKRVWVESGWIFTVIPPDEKRRPDRLIALGRDINDNGKPDLVVWDYTGGAHCCISLYVYEMGRREFTPLANIDCGHGEPQWGDLDLDGQVEFIVRDWTFAYWRYPFTEHRAPRVVYHYRDRIWKVDLSLMRKKAPSRASLEERSVRISRKEKAPSELYGIMLDLIYTGHADLAWTFFEKAWPKKDPEKKEYLEDFKNQLRQSPHWKDLQALNPGLLRRDEGSHPDDKHSP